MIKKLFMLIVIVAISIPGFSYAHQLDDKQSLEQEAEKYVNVMVLPAQQVMNLVETADEANVVPYDDPYSETTKNNGLLKENGSKIVDKYCSEIQRKAPDIPDSLGLIDTCTDGDTRLTVPIILNINSIFYNLDGHYLQV